MRRLWAVVVACGLAAPAGGQEPPPWPPPPDLVLARDEVILPARAPEPEALHLLLGYRTWLSQGRSVTSTAGPGGVPNVLSELTWSRLNNAIQEFRVESVWFEHLLGDVSLGGGTGGSGRLRDQDFDGSDRTEMFSDSRHPAEASDLAYVTLDVGYRLFNAGGPRLGWTLDLLAGYQYWEERYVAHGGQQVHPDAWPFPDGPVITNTFQWHALRLGGRTELRLPRWTFGTGLFLVPLTSLRNEDVHHLRDDLYRDPSFVDRATGGFGVLLDVTASYRVWRGLSLEAGYRLWSLEAGEGTTTSRAPDGDGVSALHGARTLRQGLLLGLNYRF